MSLGGQRHWIETHKGRDTFDCVPPFGTHPATTNRGFPLLGSTPKEKKLSFIINKFHLIFAEIFGRVYLYDTTEKRRL